MRRHFLRCVSFIGAVLFCTASQAQAFRAYLSVDGLDTNPCTVSAPCRLLPAALNAVASGGEIWMLDSANFNSGPVSVNKSVTILAIPGAVGSLVALGGPALNIAGSGIRVALRNLVFVPLPSTPGSDGIVMTSGLELTITQSSFSGFSGRAINVDSATQVTVDETKFRNSQYGIRVGNGAALTVTRCTFANLYSYAVFLDGASTATTTRASVADTAFANSDIAVFAWSKVSGATTQASMARSTISNGEIGVAVQSDVMGAVASASASTSLFSGVGAPLYQLGTTGAVMETLQDNSARQSGSNVGTITPVPRM